MRVHRTDLVSLAFGLLFLGLSVWWLLAQILGLALPPVGWFLAGALLVTGLLGLIGALRSGRHDRKKPAAAGSEQTEPDRSAASWPGPPGGPVGTAADGFPGPGDAPFGHRETAGVPFAERETPEVRYTAPQDEEATLTGPEATDAPAVEQETAEVRLAGQETAEVRLAGPDDATAPVWGRDGTSDRFTGSQTRAIGPAGVADEWPTAAISDRPAEAVEDRPADAPDGSAQPSPAAPVTGPPAGERRSPD
ncbi:hypothetical protein ABZ807_15895 [Micromonospora sp. NPDC047548]|uniref:hypothetical protein n=1 Tax=Micromonospora sp. NPDC047548 TaxID=3155624 RepID=UPI0033DB9762